MIFASLVFLTVFLPVVLGAYYFADHRFRNTVLLAASQLFYTWGSGRMVLVLIAVGVVAFLGGQLLQTTEAKSNHAMRIGLIAGITALCLSPLLYFKYAAFFSEIAATILGGIGVELPRVDCGLWLLLTETPPPLVSKLDLSDRWL